eukprot:scaffold590693_cov24-Prasinocladus_malaysianus.AAC.1
MCRSAVGSEKSHINVALDFQATGGARYSIVNFLYSTSSDTDESYKLKKCSNTATAISATKTRHAASRPSSC